MRSLPTTAAPGRKKAGGSNDLFEKCRNFTRPADLQAAGLYMYFEVFSERDGWRHCRLKQLFRERNYWLRQIDTPYWSAGTRFQMLAVLDSIRRAQTAVGGSMPDAVPRLSGAA